MADHIDNSQFPPEKYHIAEEEQDGVQLISQGKSYGVVVDYNLSEPTKKSVLGEDTLFEEVGSEFITVRVPVKKYRCLKTQKTIIERHAIQTVDKFVPYPTRTEPEPVIERVKKPKTPKPLRLKEEEADRNRRAVGPNGEDYAEADPSLEPVDANEQFLSSENAQVIERPGKTIYKKRRIYQYVPGEIEWIEKEIDEIEYIEKIQEREEERIKEVVEWVPEIVGTREIEKKVVVCVEDPENVIIDESQTIPVQIVYVDAIAHTTVGDNFDNRVESDVVTRKVAKFSGNTYIIERLHDEVVEVPVTTQVTKTPYVFQYKDEKDMTEEELIRWYGERIYNERFPKETPELEMSDKFVRRPNPDIRDMGFVAPADDETHAVVENVEATTAPIPSATTALHQKEKLSIEELRKMAQEGDEAEVVGVMAAQHPLITMQYAQSGATVYYGQPQVGFDGQYYPVQH